MANYSRRAHTFHPTDHNCFDDGTPAATSVSLRPPTIATKKVTTAAKFQPGSTPLVVGSEFVLEFDSAHVAHDDFMFDI